MSISAKERREIPDSQMGVPGKDKYPLDTKKHIKSAAHLINNGNITEEEKKALAEKIKRRAKEEGMSTENMHAVNKITTQQEQVPPMSDGTSIGNAPPGTFAAYNEEDELLKRAKMLRKPDPLTLERVREVVAKIHEKYKADSKPPTGNQNCMLCTWCAEAQFRGIDVLPRPIYSPRDPAFDVTGGESIVLSPTRLQFKSMSDMMGAISNAPYGRFYVHVNWSGGPGGHEFLLVGLNQPFVVDAQQGIVEPLTDAKTQKDYFDINWSNSYLCRLDDKRLNEPLLASMNDPGKVMAWDNEKDIRFMHDRNMLGDLSTLYTMRPATEADLEFVYQSELETVGENKNDPKVQDYLRQDAKDSLGHTQIIQINETDIGVYQAYETNYYGLREGKRDWWYLAHIYINPEYRSMGIGTAIIKNDMDAHDKILLQVMKSNPRAKALYESLGFVVTQENDHGGLIMRYDKSKSEAVQEVACAASLLTVKNQLSQQLGSDYEFIGGSLVPKFTIKYKAKPGLSFEVNVNGANIEVTPCYNNIPDLVHKRKGIAFMQAANVVAKFIEDTVRDYKPVQESFAGMFIMDDQPDEPILEGDTDGAVQEAKNDGKIYKIIYDKMTDKWDEFIELPVNAFGSDVVLACMASDFSKMPKEPIQVTTSDHMGGMAYPDFMYDGAVPLFSKHLFKAMSEVGTDHMFQIPVRIINELDQTFRDYILGLPPRVNPDEISKYPIFKTSDQKDNRIYVNEEMRDLLEEYEPIGMRIYPADNIVQEGAIQDIKNGVNPFSDDMVFHVTPEKHADGQVWQPRVPDYLEPYNPEDTGFEDNTTGRICFSTSIEGCLNGITVNLPRQNPAQFDKMYVYIPEKPWKEYKHKTNKELVKGKLVYDANVTREVWILEPVRMKLYGVIKVDQVSDANRKAVVPTSKGQKDTRNYFTYKWHWVVKPKVLKKATKFDYSVETVLSNLCIDIKKFKYGLIRDGRLQTGNVSDADYERYWVFHSGEEVDRAGGGNCYDMVEYEAGYLEAYGVTYKKYFMNFTKPDGKTVVNTHTICVVPHDGKYIYIEQAFKRVIDEWGSERQKTFETLDDLFYYVAEVSAEYNNQDLNFGVWDYTNEKIDYGTPIKNFQDWIFKKCKMVQDGEVKKKSDKEA